MSKEQVKESVVQTAESDGTLFDLIHNRVENLEQAKGVMDKFKSRPGIAEAISIGLLQYEEAEWGCSLICRTAPKGRDACNSHFCSLVASISISGDAAIKGVISLYTLTYLAEYMNLVEEEFYKKLMLCYWQVFLYKTRIIVDKEKKEWCETT